VGVKITYETYLWDRTLGVGDQGSGARDQGQAKRSLGPPLNQDLSIPYLVSFFSYPMGITQSNISPLSCKRSMISFLL